MIVSVVIVSFIHSNPHFLERWEGLTNAQREEFGRGHLALTDELAASGELVVSEGLAARFPDAVWGLVEVRPVLDMSSWDL